MEGIHKISDNIVRTRIALYFGGEYKDLTDKFPEEKKETFSFDFS
jgi:hypothetical protein